MTLLQNYSFNILFGRFYLIMYTVIIWSFSLHSPILAHKMALYIMTSDMLLISITDPFLSVLRLFGWVHVCSHQSFSGVEWSYRVCRKGLPTILPLWCFAGYTNYFSNTFGSVIFLILLKRKSCTGTLSMNGWTFPNCLVHLLFFIWLATSTTMEKSLYITAMGACTFSFILSSHPASHI